MNNSTSDWLVLIRPYVAGFEPTADMMCRNDEMDVLAKIQQLIHHIQARSERLWGIRPVIVVKTAAGEPVSQVNVAKDAAETLPQPNPLASIPAIRIDTFASQHSSGRSARPNRKRRGSLQPSST